MKGEGGGGQFEKQRGRYLFNGLIVLASRQENGERVLKGGRDLPDWMKKVQAEKQSWGEEEKNNCVISLKGGELGKKYRQRGGVAKSEKERSWWGKNQAGGRLSGNEKKKQHQYLRSKDRNAVWYCSKGGSRSWGEAEATGWEKRGRGKCRPWGEISGNPGWAKGGVQN